MKKFLAVLLAVIMVMALSVTAFATVDPTLGSWEGSQDRGYGVTGTGNLEVPLTKSIVIFNPENGTNVREPNIKFVYDVTPVTDTALLGTITDDGRYNQVGGVDTPVTVKVNAGVAGTLTGTEIAFGEANTVAAKTTGTEVEKTSNLTVNLANFTHAGVYRYKITESVKDLSNNATTVEAYGLEARETNYSNERYIDLYIANDEANPGSFKLTGAIIFKVNTKDDSNTAATSAITVTTDKTTGFEPGTPASGSGDPDYTNDETVDRYFTYNLKVGKTTTGALADKSHDFPFEIKLTGALTPVVKTDLTVTGATNITAGVQNISTTELTLSPKMSNGDYIELKGIPKGTTVTVKETNDTPDQYAASWDAVVGTNSTTVTAVSDNADTTDLNLPNGKSAMTSAAVAIDAAQDRSGTDIAGSYLKTELGFTNNLAEISPTGITLRFAPYALILAMGTMLLLFSRKARKTED